MVESHPIESAAHARRPLATVVLLASLAVLPLVGCDQEAAQRSEADRRFRAAVETMRVAEIGFVPTKRSEGIPTAEELDRYTSQIRAGQMDPEDSRLQVYRQDSLAKARTELEPVIQSGTPSQSRAARRLLADIYESSSRFKAREALTRWSAISNRSATMLSYMIALGQTLARAEGYKTDDAPLFLKLQDDQQVTNRSIDKLKRDADAVDQEIARRKAKFEEFDKQVDDLRAQARKLKDDAFVKEGTHRWDLYDQASALDRRASELSAKAQQEGVHLEVAQSERKLVSEQMDFARRFLKSLETQIEETAARQSEIQSRRVKADEARKIAEQLLVDELSEVIRQYTAGVEVTMKEAIEDADKAIDVLQQAAQSASGAEKRAIELELLGKQSSKADILTSHAMAIAGIGTKVQVVARRADGKIGPALMKDRAEFVNTLFNQLASEQQQVIVVARNSIGDGLALAKSLGDGAAEDDAIARRAAEFTSRLEKYNTRLEELKLSST